MTVIINPTITFNGKEAVDGILEGMYYKPEFTRIHTIYPNIIAKEQIAFLQRIGKISKKDLGCGTGKTSKEIPMYEKFWDPQPIKVWMESCWTAFISSFWVWGMKKGINRADLTDTDFADYLMDVLPDAMLEDLWRMVWFGDTAISHVGASPEGTLGSSTDIVFYNAIDGLWKQIFAGVAIGVGTWGHIPRHTIAQNGLSTYALQLALTDGQSKSIFKDMIIKSDSRLRHSKNRVIFCTDTIFQNWIDYKESKVLESSFRREDDEFSEGIMRGVKILPIEIWDRIIQGDFADGTKYYLPHRAVLTTVDEIAVGFDAPEDSTNFKNFLDESTELYNTKGAYRLDAKIIENHMFSVAY